METTIEMQELFCWTCGVLYCAPKKYTEAKIKNDEPIHCPNGHENEYVWDSKKEAESEKIKELRREHMLALHHADQAAARAQDGKEPKDQHEQPVDAVKPVITASGRLQCPHCDLSYRLRSGLAKHLHKNHSVATFEEAEKLVNRRIYEDETGRKWEDAQ